MKKLLYIMIRVPLILLLVQFCDLFGVDDISSQLSLAESTQSTVANLSVANYSSSSRSGLVTAKSTLQAKADATCAEASTKLNNIATARANILVDLADMVITESEANSRLAALLVRITQINSVLLAVSGAVTIATNATSIGPVTSAYNNLMSILSNPWGV